VALRDFFTELAADFAALPRPAGVELHWRPGDELSLLTDRRKLRMILKNLVGNALKFTPDGSVTVRYAADAGRCTFEVEDTGIGIAPEHIPRLTERFYRVDRSRSRETGGTGLGLAIVKHAIARHQASLEVESRPGRGSRFTIRFPQARTVPGEQSLVK
jgi:two-component system phosphate regulon sensor histidine kinase PhoR